LRKQTLKKTPKYRHNSPIWGISPFHAEQEPREAALYFFAPANLTQPTRAAFPSSLSVGTAAASSNHGAAAPPRHAQAASRLDSVAVVGSIAGEGEKRGIEK
jgi:hypothetical protein